MIRWAFLFSSTKCGGRELENAGYTKTFLNQWVSCVQVNFFALTYSVFNVIFARTSPPRKENKQRKKMAKSFRFILSNAIRGSLAFTSHTRCYMFWWLHNKEGLSLPCFHIDKKNQAIAKTSAAKETIWNLFMFITGLLKERAQGYRITHLYFTLELFYSAG